MSGPAPDSIIGARALERLADHPAPYRRQNGARWRANETANPSGMAVGAAEIGLDELPLTPERVWRAAQPSLESRLPTRPFASNRYDSV